MRFFNRKASPKQGANKDTALGESKATTVASSQNESMSNIEKETAPETTAMPSTTSADGDKEKTLETETAPATTTDGKEVEIKGMAEQDVLDQEEDEVIYPEGIRLFIITLALCMSVFLVALVDAPLQAKDRLKIVADSELRTTPSLPRQFLESRIISKR